VDNFHDWAKSSEYMRSSPVFAANPIGVFFDPDRAYEAAVRPPRLLFARCSPAGNASAMAVIATMPDPSRATAISTRCSVASGLLDDRRKIMNLRV
jgi:hypothetical protein